MLSLTDLKHKQIIFIQPEFQKENDLRIQNDNLIWKKDGKLVNQISCYNLLSVFVVGDCSLSTKLLQKLKGFGVAIFLLKRNLSFYACLESAAEGNFLLRQEQYLMEGQKELQIAKKLVLNKVKNQLKLIYPIGTDFKKHKKLAEELIESAADEKVLLSIEGRFAKIFYKRYFQEISWKNRLPQVKNDIPNFLLDVGYTYLFNLVDSYLRLFGFDTYKGVYHKLYFERKSLACDLMEPFRCLIDRQLLKSYRLKQIDEKDFKIVQTQYVLDYKQNSKYSGLFLTALLDKKCEIYEYIQKYYRYFMRPEKYKFPEFKI